ncbi:enoyl-CoA hydratase-related protein [Pseudofrankia sp. BMG5.36]|uniref:enoyl-CoA hydratase/isomerase family protein n=1 Tax=Pseudofrankia sp. BMG5.36 TaxID=1834512 RepID=UPI0008D93F6E|nr:enoyl-CoA hydratase-related protein [Pseudofrankia sp. BMG5.36]OHV42673.1 enoyl-CoA hydratase [Pseudofrankia sp. BMG5.36]
MTGEAAPDEGAADGSERPAVGYALDGPVAWLTIDRPERRNALSAEVRAGLWTGVRRFRDDVDAAVLVMTAAGDRAFCAGGDLKEMATETLRVPPPDYLPQIGRNIEIDKPVIAAVNGVAYAGGFLLTQCADLVVAAEHARFAITEAKVGRGTPWAASLPYLLPPRVVMHMLLTGEPVSARRGYELGLVNEVVPADQLRAAAHDLALRVAANAPLSVRLAKQTVGLLARYPVERAYEEAERLWEPVYLSDDAQEGPRAFREGRRPVWKGR